MLPTIDELRSSAHRLDDGRVAVPEHVVKPVSLEDLSAAIERTRRKKSSGVGSAGPNLRVVGGA